MSSSKKKRTKASAPFSLFSLAAAGTVDDALGDGLAVTDAEGDALLRVADGIPLAGGPSSRDSHAPSASAPASATSANGIPIDRRVMRPFPAAPRRPAAKR